MHTICSRVRFTRGGVCLSACWDTTPPEQAHPLRTRHPSPRGQTHACKNITFATSLRMVKRNHTHPFAVLGDDELWLHFATDAEKFDDILVVELVEHVDLAPEVEQVMLVSRQQRLNNNERLQLPLPDPVSLCEKHVTIVTLTCNK